jgi:thiol-disulfide isomerase/thioredoxin
LLKEYQAADDAWNKRYTAGVDNAALVDWEGQYRDWPGWAFAPRFLELAEASPDDPVALDALVWVVNRSLNVGVGDRELYLHHRRAVELLARGDRFDDRRLREAYRFALAYASPHTEQFLLAALEKGRDRGVRGLACLGLARLLVSKREIALSPWFADEARTPFQAYMAARLAPEFLRYFREADPKGVTDEAKRLFERAATEYGDLVYRPGARRDGGDLTVAEAARSDLHELLDLAVGREAPEIEGEDVDGKRFKLSDYRGKVVALVFSGDWCGPCREMYPQERDLAERLKGQPFALLGVNTDKAQQTLRDSVALGEVTWRCWWDGPPGGPICTAWDVHSFPTVYVLDRKGVIRYKQLRAEKLDRALESLLKEAVDQGS